MQGIVRPPVKKHTKIPTKTPNQAALLMKYWDIYPKATNADAGNDPTEQFRTMNKYIFTHLLCQAIICCHLLIGTVTYLLLFHLCMFLTYKWYKYTTEGKQKTQLSAEHNLIHSSLWIMKTVAGCFSHVEPEIRGVNWACGDALERRVHTLYTLHVRDAQSHTRQLLYIKVILGSLTHTHTHI